MKVKRREREWGGEGGGGGGGGGGEAKKGTRKRKGRRERRKEWRRNLVVDGEKLQKGRGFLLFLLFLSKGHSMARGSSLNSRVGSYGWLSGSKISVMELRVLTAVD